MPESLQGRVFSGSRFSYCMDARALLFVIPQVARYYASEGQKIVIEPDDAVPDMRTVRLYVLATVMAAILLQKGRLPLHASGILKNGDLTLITGDSKAGKSTTLAGLFRKGHILFSDDVVVLQREEFGGVEAAASYPMMKLWNDTLIKMNDALFSDRSFRVRNDLDKYGFFFHSVFDCGLYSVKKVFVLKTGEVLCITSRMLSGSDAFDVLTKQVYRPMLIQNNDLKFLCFNLLIEIVKNSSICEISRPLVCDPACLSEYVESRL